MINEVRAFAKQLGLRCSYTPNGDLIVYNPYSDAWTERRFINSLEMFDLYERQNNYATRDELERIICRMMGGLCQ